MCSGNLQTNCTACATDYFLEGTECKLTCPIRKYPNTNNNKCDLCNLACNKCTGPTFDQCQECYTGFYLDG